MSSLGALKKRKSSPKIFILLTISSFVIELIFPPSKSESTNVPIPTLDIVPGLLAAISLNICAITPCGKL